MLQTTFVIKNKTGLHARPASLFVKKAGSFISKISIIKENKEIDAKSIISLLSLGAGRGDTITIVTEGGDEKTAMEELISLLQELDD